MVCVNSTELEVYQLDQCIDFTALHRVNPQRYPFILESSAQAEDVLSKDKCSSKHARYNILFAFPLDSLTLYSDNQLIGDVINSEKDFLSNLDLNWLRHKKNIDKSPRLFPFTGGWFVYLSYELAAQIEERLTLPKSEKQTITAKLSRVPIAIIHDKHTDTQSNIDEKDHKDKISIILENIKRAVTTKFIAQKNNLKLKEERAGRYIDSVKKVKRYIKDGDVFKVKLSRV